MTGASNLGMFGSGLDFSGSSWRGNFGRLGESTNGHGNSLYDAVGMIWRWWLLDPDAPTRHKETVTLVPQEYVKTGSFADLVNSLDFVWVQEPESIVELLQLLLKMNNGSQNGLLQKTCSWIRAEIALGSMSERTIKTILWDLGQSVASLRRGSSVQGAEQKTMVYESIADGVVQSTIRPVQNISKDTIWMILRSLASTALSESKSFNCVSSILQCMMEAQPDIATQFLTSILETIAMRPGGKPKDWLSSLLRDLPSSISSTAIATTGQLLTKKCKSKQNSSGMQNLELFLRQLSNSNVFHSLRKQDTPWLEMEHWLCQLEMPSVVTYLMTASEATICVYILNHVAGASEYSTISQRKRSCAKAALSKFQELANDQQTYSNLIHIIEENDPEKMRPTLRFIYTFFRTSERLLECYNLSQYLFSKRNLRGRVCIEFFHNEIDLWAEKYPVFAVILLATDRRPGIMNHPVVLRTLSSISSEVNDLPMETMSKLANTLIKAHGETLKSSIHQESSRNESVLVLVLLLESIAWGQCDERKAFGIAQRILTLLGPVSQSFGKETSVAITNIVAIKALEAGRKIPTWKLEWLAQVVTQLEGSDVWREISYMIENWWAAIETKQDSNGRKWRDGVGWVYK